MSERKVLYMSFTDSEGKTSALSIEDPKDELTLATVRNAAENIVAQGIMESASGTFAAFKGAKIVTTKTEELI